MGFWIWSSGKDFIKRGMDSKVARASLTSSLVDLGLGTGPILDEAILVFWIAADVGPVFAAPILCVPS